MSTCKVTFQFEKAYENKYPVYDIIINGNPLDFMDPVSLIEGKKEVELSEGKHIIEIIQNNFFSKSTPVDDTIKMVSRLTDAKPYKYEESPYFVSMEGILEVHGDGTVNIKLMELSEGRDFTKYSLDISCENDVKISSQNQKCISNKSATLKWIFHKCFVVFLGLCLALLFSFGSIFAFNGKSFFIGVIFMGMGLGLFIITAVALAVVIDKYIRDKKFRTRKVFLDEKNHEIKISKDNE
ncbi:MAG: hypothetical protein IKZ25_01585 [Clostridia bacterium]|nr:hypothetical protein [Clostridia bacterium]